MKRINVAEFKKEVEGAKESMLKLIPVEDILKMEPEAINAINRTFKLLDVSLNLVVEQSEALNEINEKLNLLLDTKMKDRA